MRLFKKRTLSRDKSMVEPDEIFLDSYNIQNFDRQQFEGRIEKAISKQTVLRLGIFFSVVVAIFGFRLGYLQIHKGQAYLERSERNMLEKQYLFADRGIIYDRNGVELAWNKPARDASGTAPADGRAKGQDLPVRAYFGPGFSHVLGYISYPAKDDRGIYWQTEFIGKDGLEKQYNDHLRGINGEKIVEIDARGEVRSENMINIPKRGQDLKTTIDSRVQQKLFEIIGDLSETNKFAGGAGVILDITKGEVIASTSFPEYNSEILSLGKDDETIQKFLSDKRKVFLDRTISGLYTPGSIVKPFFAMGALAEGIIDPFKEILSTGSLSVPNPYFPDKPTIFKDWKAHGYTAMREAIAVSSDVYFYEIGGGFEPDNQQGLGILNLEKYAELFGIGRKTGVDLPDEREGLIPSPEWKARVFQGDPWRLGDTYNTVIGQYGFQVTLMQMVRAMAAVANYGTLLTPHFILDSRNATEKIYSIELPPEYFKVAHEGMREAVTYGTATLLNIPHVEVAAKTGTAQLGAENNRVNSWVIGFFPYQNPKYAFAAMMESGPSSGVVGATSIMRGLFDWMYWETPEYFQ